MLFSTLVNMLFSTLVNIVCLLFHTLSLTFPFTPVEACLFILQFYMTEVTSFNLGHTKALKLTNIHRYTSIPMTSHI